MAIGGKKSLRVKGPATGGSATFKPLSFGKTYFSKGEHKIELKLKVRVGKPLILKSATLKPVK